METAKKAAKKAAILIVILGVISALFFICISETNAPYMKKSISNTDDIIGFLNELGWECDPLSISAKETVLPESFDEILQSYNELQLAQGLDLSRYNGKQVTIYTLNILNYSGYTDTVYATVIIHKNKIIGGDIHAAAMDGFMHSLI